MMASSRKKRKCKHASERSVRQLYDDVIRNQSPTLPAFEVYSAAWGFLDTLVHETFYEVFQDCPSGGWSIQWFVDQVTPHVKSSKHAQTLRDDLKYLQEGDRIEIGGYRNIGDYYVYWNDKKNTTYMVPFESFHNSDYCYKLPDQACRMMALVPNADVFRLRHGCFEV